MLEFWPVYFVEAAGFGQAAWLLSKRPWNPSRQGAKDATNEAVSASSTGSPRLLLAFRAFVAVWSLVVGGRQLLAKGPIVLKFYTVWNWWLMTAFFWLAAAASIQGQMKKSVSSSTANRVGRAAIILYHMNSTTVWIVDVLCWALLVPMLTSDPDQQLVAFWKSQFYNFTSYNMHAANAVFMLLELALNRIPFYPYMLGYVGLWSTIYGLWSITHYFIFGRWLYPFLDAAKPWAAFCYLGIFLVHWIFTGIHLGLHRLKMRLAPALNLQLKID
ncbi:hypothetical protein WJX74_005289 [Apatococcus lobatus]|uniref:Uncharacterized protein n=1 Tax=Apatococcus lobatus TaxID=904363 RepID=A0AAW1SER5_9CHLO